MSDESNAIVELVSLLERCGKTFRLYETSHRAKGTVEGKEKAEVNRTAAMACEAAVAKWAPIPEELRRDAEAALGHPMSDDGLRELVRQEKRDELIDAIYNALLKVQSFDTTLNTLARTAAEVVLGKPTA